MPELVARTPVIIEYYSLSDNDLLQIMNIAAVSSIEVWREHFKLLGKTLVVTEDAKRYAVEKAQFLKMGARGLQQVMFQALAGIAFDASRRNRNIHRNGAELMQVAMSEWKKVRDG